NNKAIIAKVMFFMSYDLVIIALLLFLVGIIVWWRDVIRERTYDGRHIHVVVRGLMVGIVLFIVSELE
ncbi:cytochrome c oxidase subunit 3, partial [Pseudoalteromonas sp. BMB]|uniref:cytochrome c oxidase subunit 3 n=1 Tax=Pseudoalteromonas sp. BMB TaxID=1874619 RepID=UPI001586ED5A